MEFEKKRKAGVSVPYRGDMISNYAQRFNAGHIVVSVPYRGDMISNNTLFFFVGSHEFPSPIGEIWFQMVWLQYPCLLLFGFRPLSGRYDFKFHTPLPQRKKSGVSVPYRGDMISNNKQSETTNNISFRPLSGRYDFKFESENEGKLCSFPSPIGEIWFQIDDGNHAGHAISGFRPLSGRYDFKFLERRRKPHEKIRFPSPIGEIWFQMGT